MCVNSDVENQPQPPRKPVKKVEIKPGGICRYVGPECVPNELHTIIEIEGAAALKMILTISEERTWRGPIGLFEKEFTSAA